VALSGGMIIQNYDYRVRCGGRTVYEGDTYFGFFTRTARGLYYLTLRRPTIPPSDAPGAWPHTRP